MRLHQYRLLAYLRAEASLPFTKPHERARISKEISVFLRHLVPKNLTGMPNRLRRLYNRASRPLIRMDEWLCQAPVLNQVAGVIEFAKLKVIQREEKTMGEK